MNFDMFYAMRPEIRFIAELMLAQGRKYTRHGSRMNQAFVQRAIHMP